jgi:general secretion pathway protein G
MRRAAVLAVLLLACRQEAHPQAREEALRHDLMEMRNAIADFRQDKGRGPHSLEELKSAHYLRDIPKDPITMLPEWRVTIEQHVGNDDFVQTTAAPAEPEVIDVHSRAAGRDSAGKPYADY